MSLMRKHGLRIARAKAGIRSIESSYHGRMLAAKLAGGAPGREARGIDREALLEAVDVIGGRDRRGAE